MALGRINCRRAKAEAQVQLGNVETIQTKDDEGGLPQHVGYGDGEKLSSSGNRVNRICCCTESQMMKGQE